MSHQKISNCTFCGPPLMNQAVQKMGEDFGIPDEHIRFDDFGG